MNSPRIALVGHCGPDAYMLRSSIKYVMKDAEIAMINDSEALEQAIERGIQILLINRVLDYGFENRAGVELIRKLKKSNSGLKMMLISDFPDAQLEAEQSGALPGFGKSQVGGARMKEVLAGLDE